MLQIGVFKPELVNYVTKNISNLWITNILTLNMVKFIKLIKVQLESFLKFGS